MARLSYNGISGYIVYKIITFQIVSCKGALCNGKKKIVRGIILAVLLVCAVFLIYSIVTDPLGEHDIMLALAVTAGFIALEQDKRKER